ncbi:MAG: hypothetical protein WAL75_04580 [Terracidiphilus sp.]
MPVTLTDTSVEFAKPERLNNLNDDEFYEEIVALFIGHANAERRVAGLPELRIGSLCSAPSVEPARPQLAA